MKTETAGAQTQEKEFNPVTTKIKMLKDWNQAQFQQMNRQIAKYFKGKSIEYKTGQEEGVRSFGGQSFALVGGFLGLAYTSTGIFACYGVCNVAAYLDADHIYKYDYFTIGENGSFYAICQDNEENEICIEI